jgi:hypothetical protein
MPIQGKTVSPNLSTSIFSSQACHFILFLLTHQQ